MAVQCSGHRGQGGERMWRENVERWMGGTGFGTVAAWVESEMAQRHICNEDGCGSASKSQFVNTHQCNDKKPPPPHMPVQWQRQALCHYTCQCNDGDGPTLLCMLVQRWEASITAHTGVTMKTNPHCHTCWHDNDRPALPCMLAWQRQAHIAVHASATMKEQQTVMHTGITAWRSVWVLGSPWVVMHAGNDNEWSRGHSQTPALPSLHKTGAQPIAHTDMMARMSAEVSYLFSPPHTDETADGEDDKWSTGA